MKTAYRCAFTLRHGVLRLAKLAAPLRYVWSWPDMDPAALDPAMVIVSRESDGRWYVTFTVDANVPEPLAETGRAVGVDLGVRDFAVTSDGEKIANPRHLERAAWLSSAAGAPPARPARRAGTGWRSYPCLPGTGRARAAAPGMTGTSTPRRTSLRQVVP